MKKLALERERATHPALRRCSTSPSRAPTGRPSLSHTTRHCHTPPVIVTHHPSLSHITRHCFTPPVIVTHHPSLSHTTLHCHTPPVIVTHHPSLSHTTRHCLTPPVIVSHHLSLSHTTRPIRAPRGRPSLSDTTLHCDTPPVIVTHHPSLSHTTRHCLTPPVIVSHHPSNPPLRSWFTELQTSVLHSSRMQQALPHPPVLGERNCKSLRSLLMPSILPTPPDADPGCFRCDKCPCIICTSHLVETSTFNSSTTKESFQIRHRLRVKVLTLCPSSLPHLPAITIRGRNKEYTQD